MNNNAKQLGIVSIVPKGDWIPNTFYQKLSLVNHAGASFLSKEDVLSAEPGVTDGWQNFWMLIGEEGISEEEVNAAIASAVDSFSIEVNQRISTAIDPLKVQISEKAEQSDVDALQRKVSALEAAAEGKLFDFLTVSDGTVPNNALPYAQIMSVSGKSYIRSRNLFPFWPTFENKIGTVTLNGIVRTINADGSVMLNGTATKDFIIWLLVVADDFRPAGGYLFLSGCPAGGSETTYRMQANVHNTNGVAYTKFMDTGDGSGLYLSDEDFSCITLAIRIAEGTVCDNLFFRPQLEYGFWSSSFEPYTLKDAKAVGLKVGYRDLGTSVKTSSINTTGFVRFIRNNSLFLRYDKGVPEENVDARFPFQLDLRDASYNGTVSLFVKLSNLVGKRASLWLTVGQNRRYLDLVDSEWVRLQTTVSDMTGDGNKFSVSIRSDGETVPQCALSFITVKGDVTVAEFEAGLSTLEFPSAVINNGYFGIGDGENNAWLVPEDRLRVLYSLGYATDNDYVYLHDNTMAIINGISINYFDLDMSFEGVLSIPQGVDCEIQILPRYSDTPLENLFCSITYQVKVVN